MRAEVFCDSNVLRYAASNAPEDAGKRAAARRVLALPGVGFSVQVLKEFYVNATGKRALRLSEEEAGGDFAGAVRISHSAADGGSGVRRRGGEKAVSDFVLGCRHCRRRAGSRRARTFHRRPERRAGLRRGAGGESVQIDGVQRCLRSSRFAVRDCHSAMGRVVSPATRERTSD